MQVLLPVFPYVWQTYGEGQEKNGHDFTSYEEDFLVLDM